MNRRISINTIGYAVPQSFITKSKQRLKQHIDTVYLKNGDEFEIELFNPTQNKVLAKIEMNGNSIGGGGIILRPGERIFLERYIDEAKRFLFETYVVNGNNQEVQGAIAKNGDVCVKFYNELVSSGTGFVTINNPITWTTNTPFTYTTHNTIGNTSLTTTSTTNNMLLNASFTSGVNHNFNITSNGIDTNSIFTKKATSEIRHVKTGRVEKGSESNQVFTYDNSSFFSFPCASNWWKIKPQSTKPVVIEELVTYCAECGSKRKKDTHKFCPHCGTKF